MSSPQYGERSPDGYYWWDGTNWQPVDQADGQTGGDAANAAQSPAGQSPADQAGPGGGGADADSGQAVLAKVSDPSELEGHFESAMAAAEGEATELEA
jgi:hypothetical protein